MMPYRRIFTLLIISTQLFLVLFMPPIAQAGPLGRNEKFSPLEGSITSTLEVLKINNVGYTWQTVSLENSYTSAIPICTYILPSVADNPAAIRIRNITATSFDIKVQQPVDSSAVTASDVFCIVAEEGIHTLSNGRTFEAHSVLSTNVSGSNAGGWANGENVSADILGVYTNPAVLGQVISYNNPEFSIFWSYDCDTQSNPPFHTGMADGICVGRHIGEVTGGSLSLTRNNEEIGYIVIEGDPDGGGVDREGNLTTGVRYEVSLGNNAIDGADDSGASYNLLNSGYTIGIASISAMDGSNGGWAVLYGANPLTGSQIDLAIDEDTLSDAERSHLAEQVAYWVFVSDPGLSWMESFVIPNVGSSWQTIPLTNNYTNMVPVCTYNLPDNIENEALPRIQNIDNAGDSFEIRIQRPRNSTSVTAADVHCVVVEEGIHTLSDINPALDRTIEAHIVTSDQFNENNDWNASRMENVGYSNVYNQPVVLGHVITFNDSDFSAFWSSNGSQTSPPNSANLYVGKHVGEDPGTTALNDELLGYLIVEGGSGFSDGFFYEAALGADTIAGTGNSPPYSYVLSRSYSYGVATDEAEDGGNGGWAVLYGNNPLAGAEIDLAVEEETAAGDTTRTHTQEQVAYWVFEPVIGGTVWDDVDLDGDLEAAEPRINNATVWLCPDSHVIPPSAPNCQSTTTDVNGDYYFQNTPAGNYYLAVDDPNPAQSSTWGGNHDPSINDQIDDGVPSAAGYTNSQTFTITTGMGSTYFDFGYATNADIGGTVWNDISADGNLDVGEIGFGGTTVWLCPGSHVMPPANPPCLSTITDGLGDYYFRNITSGDYYFAVADPLPSFISTAGGNDNPTINDQVDDGEPYSGGGFVESQDFTYISTANLTSFDFGYSEFVEIGGIVWEDLDGDGIQKGVINGIPNIDIELFNSSNISQGTITTNALGTYLFSPFLAGDYYLTFTLPGGYIFSPQDQGGDDNQDSDPDRTSWDTTIFSIAPGETDTSWDAGMYLGSAHIFDPPAGYKSVNNSGWPTLVWRQVWINDGNIAANLVEITDPIPANTTYITGSLTAIATGTSSTSTYGYDGINDDIFWEGTIDPDPGATNETTAFNEVIIIFETTVTAGGTQVENQASAYWDENGDGSVSPADNNVQNSTPTLSDDPNTAAPFDPVVATMPRSSLPETGFPPGTISEMPIQAPKQLYFDTELVISIPSINITLPITGVPYQDGSWNTSWLGDRAGYLEGSAFPTHSGNTVITAHVWDSYNQPGPFFGIKDLVYGDEIQIRAWSKIYHYQVQENRLVSPNAINTIFQHKDRDWISLLTCEGWDNSQGIYSNRRLVRGVLIRVNSE